MTSQNPKPEVVAFRNLSSMHVFASEDTIDISYSYFDVVAIYAIRDNLLYRPAFFICLISMLCSLISVVFSQDLTPDGRIAL